MQKFGWAILLLARLTVQKRATDNDGILEHLNGICEDTTVNQALCATLPQSFKTLLAGDCDPELPAKIQVWINKIHKGLSDNMQVAAAGEVLGVAGLGKILELMGAVDTVGTLADKGAKQLLGSDSSEQTLDSMMPGNEMVENGTTKMQLAQGGLLVLGLAADFLLWPITWGACTWSVLGTNAAISAPAFMATNAFELTKTLVARSFFGLYKQKCPDSFTDLNIDALKNDGDALVRASTAKIDASPSAPETQVSTGDMTSTQENKFSDLVNIVNGDNAMLSQSIALPSVTWHKRLKDGANEIGTPAAHIDDTHNPLDDD